MRIYVVRLPRFLSYIICKIIQLFSKKEKKAV
ncbi:MAG: stage V sporulation protein SpoVM [Bacilli bacterium]